MVKCINLFDEFGPGLGLPKISDFFEKEPYPGKEKIIKYLKNGRPTYASASKAVDVISGETIPIERYGMTDGEFSWISSLYYYVDKYNLRLDKKFEEKVLKA